MKLIKLCSVFLLCAVLGALAEQQGKDATVIIEMDRALNNAIMRHDTNAAEPYYTDDFLLTTSSGKFKTKQDILKEIGSPDIQWERNDTGDIRVRVHGDTAVLTGVLHQKGSASGTSFDARLYVTDTWVRSEGKWKLLAGHATRVPQ